MITAATNDTNMPPPCNSMDIDMAKDSRDKAGEKIQYATSPWSLGQVLVAATERGICAVLFGDDADALTDDLELRFPDANLQRGKEEFGSVIAVVLKFIENPTESAEFQIDPDGTDFQIRVWQALREIEPGTTASYKDIATRIGSPKAVRAVARACAANPIAVAIPCHRVVRGDGSLSGYRWGIERKRILLEREAIQ